MLSATVERASDYPAADKEIFRPTFHILQRALHSARKIFGSFSPLSSTGVLRLISGVLPRLRVFSRPFRHRGCMGQNFAYFGVIFSGLYNKVVKPLLLTVSLSFSSGVDLCLILRGSVGRIFPPFPFTCLRESVVLRSGFVFTQGLNIHNAFRPSNLFKTKKATLEGSPTKSYYITKAPSLSTVSAKVFQNLQYGHILQKSFQIVHKIC